MSTQPGFSDSRIKEDAEGNAVGASNGESKGMTKTPPPMYAVMRAGTTVVEPLRAETDEEAMATIKRQVRTGQIAVVYLYKMVCAEVFEPTSNTLSLEDLRESKFSISGGNGINAGVGSALGAVGAGAGMNGSMQ